MYDGSPNIADATNVTALFVSGGALYRWSYPMYVNYEN